MITKEPQGQLLWDSWKIVSTLDGWVVSVALLALIFPLEWVPLKRLINKRRREEEEDALKASPFHCHASNAW